MPQTDLTKALSECYEAAKSGYELASDEKAALDKILRSAEETIRETAIEYKASPCEVIGLGEALEGQLADIQQSVDSLRISFTEDLNALKEDLEKFSVTLFGRTMAGKSTLMEVLTEGDGSAIGMGAQRTTRDIRRYEWNGLAVTDVPGIGAFEGEEDTRLAFDAAKTADLIVFLLTDDAPQAVEADCFRQVKDLGKPVIIIMNVKVSVDSGKSMKLIERDMNRAFDDERIEEIRKQFCRFAEPFGQDWNNVPFVATHLKAAYEAVKSAKAGDTEQEEFWTRISRIDNLKSLICEEVRVRGKYIRVKTFADIIANPMIEALSVLDAHRDMNEQKKMIIAEKKHTLLKRKESFIRESKKRIEAFMMRLKTELRVDIANFAEDHYDDKMADIEWEKFIKNKDIETKCRELLDDMESEVNSFVQEMLREMASQLNYVSVDVMDRNFLTPAFVDTKSIVNWTSLILGTGGAAACTIMSLAGVGAAITGPVGWISIAIGITGGIGVYFFETRGDKLARARAQLEKELNKSVNSLCDNYWTQLEKNLNRLVTKKIDIVLSELDRFEIVIDSLASMQYEMANSLRSELCSMNKNFINKIFSAVLSKKTATNTMSKINAIARIPGICSLLSKTPPNVINTEFCRQIGNLISEDIRVVDTNDNICQFAYNITEGLISLEYIVWNKESEEIIINGTSKDVISNYRIQLLRQLVPLKIGG